MRGGGRSKRCAGVRCARIVAVVGVSGGLALVAAAPPAQAASANVAALQVALKALGLYPVAIDGISGPADPTGRAPPPAPQATGRGRHRRTAHAPHARAPRPPEARQSRDADRPARMGRRGAPVPAQRPRLRAGRVRRRVRSSTRRPLAFSAPPRSRWTASRDPPHCGRSGTGGRRVSRAGRCASCAPSPERSGTGSAGSEAVGTRASTFLPDEGRPSAPPAAASWYSRAGTTAATATWSWSKHRLGFESWYAHLSRIAADEGKRSSAAPASATWARRDTQLAHTSTSRCATSVRPLTRCHACFRPWPLSHAPAPRQVARSPAAPTPTRGARGTATRPSPGSGAAPSVPSIASSEENSACGALVTARRPWRTSASRWRA